MVAIDPTDQRILAELEADARIAWAELGRRVGLTAPAVRQRVQRMERDGIILGYHARLSPVALGRPIDALIRIAPTSHERQQRFTAYVRERPEIVECHNLTGEDSFDVRVQVASMPELDKITTALSRFGRTTTSMVLGSPVARRGLAGGV